MKVLRHHHHSFERQTKQAMRAERRKKKKGKKPKFTRKEKLGPEKKGENLKLWFCFLSCQANLSYKPKNVLSVEDYVFCM